MDINGYEMVLRAVFMSGPYKAFKPLYEGASDIEDTFKDTSICMPVQSEQKQCREAQPLALNNKPSSLI